MKQKIFIEKKSEQIHFYLKSSALGKMYLFSQRFTKAVYDYFIQERSLNEILGFKKWYHNPRLDKTISKIPMYIRYAEREYGCRITNRSTVFRKRAMMNNLM